MVVLCDDNETCDDAPKPEARPASLPLESRNDYSKLIDGLSTLVIHVTALEAELKKFFKMTNALYEWHVARNHFPDTRGQHRCCGRVTLLAVPPLVPYEIPAASLTFEGCHTPFALDAFQRMYYHSREMRNSIYDLYLYPNDFLDTRYNWDAANGILLATCLSPSDEFPVATLNSQSCTSLDSSTPMLTIQPESNEQRTSYTTMPEPTRTRVQVESQPEPKHVAGSTLAPPCSYQDFLDALLVVETRFTALYEQCKLEHKMTKEMYEWHLSQNHFTKKGRVILSNL